MAGEQPERAKTREVPRPASPGLRGLVQLVILSPQCEETSIFVRSKKQLVDHAETKLLLVDLKRLMVKNLSQKIILES